MKLSSGSKTFILLLGDILALYISLAIALLLRYGAGFGEQLVSYHIAPFSIVFAIWLAVFHVAGLYDLSRLRNNLDFIKNLLLTLCINAGFAVALFYLIPYFGIAPKTNLLIFVFVFAILEIWWRRMFNVRASFRGGLNKVLFLGENQHIREIIETIKENSQLGYEATLWFPKDLDDTEIKRLHATVRNHRINIIVVPTHAKDNSFLTNILYQLLTFGVQVYDVSSFYETVFREIPVHEIQEEWFIENAVGQRKFYDDLKRGLEFVAALMLFIALLPIELFIALAIKMGSRGPAIYAQTRVGRNGQHFTLYKFRTMRADAEKMGAVWAKHKDERTTTIGQFLRYTHIDELPQLVNILNGELSFVGPRPERPEFVATLKEKIPYYEIRLLVKPGVTGWAQINYHKDTTEEDVTQKLQYDLYYLKNRSFVLDIAIILKTLKTLFFTPQ